MKAVALTCLALVASVEGHAYVSSPASRALKCQQQRNTNCGGVQYEPQSVEGPDRFPDSGPADGNLAGAGKFSELDEQTPTRWEKNPARAGSMTFVWTYTAGHVTADWRYFITKPGWNQNEPLKRSSFDLTPFCTVNGNSAMPSSGEGHQCTVPARSGYHVVLAVWDVGNTAASFHQVIDFDFGGGSSPSTAAPNSVPVPFTKTPGSVPVPIPVDTKAPVPVPIPVATKAPVPVPPTPSGCSSHIPVWGNCKGRESCCESGTMCNVQSQWYAQCIPGAPSVPVPPSSSCPYMIHKWGNCFAKPLCCVSGTSCHAVSRWYAQCS